LTHRAALEIESNALEKWTMVQYNFFHDEGMSLKKIYFAHKLKIYLQDREKFITLSV
jgi:hypothetical protein